MEASGLTGGTSDSGKVTGSRAVEFIQEFVLQRLRPLLRNRRLNGYPINIPFTDVEEVVDKVWFMKYRKPSDTYCC